MAKRRANGEGSLRQLENGSWCCQIMVGFKPDGSRDVRTFTAKSQKEVIRKKDAFTAKRAAGLLTGQDMRFGEWADVWYENHQDNIKPTTQEAYKYTLRILKDHFGRRMLAEIKAMDVEQFLKKLRKDGRAHSYIAQCRGMLYLHVQEPKRLEAANRFSEAFSKKGRGTHGNILDYVKSS